MPKHKKLKREDGAMSTGSAVNPRYWVQVLWQAAWWLPKDVQSLISKPVNVTWHGKRNFADLIKDFEMGRLSGWLFLKSRDSFVAGVRERCYIVSFWKRPCGKGCGNSRSWKRHANILLCSFRKGHGPAHNLILAQWDLCWASHLLNSKIINLCHYQPLSVR